MQKQQAAPPQNRLAAEKSPYLRQHRDNPVDWYPWGEDAFEAARIQNKPILLSVGYAACHWCHVMAHESFENPDIAAVMNDLFINIKLDREERPDIDMIYQRALSLMGQQGGWPLTMFLTPDGQPFWGGTYFPPETRFGRVAFPAILKQIRKLYDEQQEKVLQTVGQLGPALQAALTPSEKQFDIDLSLTDRACERILDHFDPVHGGLGDSQKFPQVPLLHMVWRGYLRTDNAAMKDAVINTLDHLCQGGIYDHVGGGFARYTVDQEWLIPHFEKMLYDNAQIIEILSLAYAETENPLYARRVAETVDFLLREMKINSGHDFAFAASYDADSEGEEGKFYVWNEAEVDRILGQESALFKKYYDVRAEGNWEHKNILNRLQMMAMADEKTERQLQQSLQKLLAAREGRVKPGFDHKALVDWNGLAIGALVYAGKIFARPDWIKAAQSILQFIQTNLCRDGKLFHAYTDHQAAHPATLDDYANIIRGAILLYEATTRENYLQFALKLAQRLQDDFWDENGGGYFFTSHDTKDVILRAKSASDHAVPAGNSTMIENMMRLFYLTGRQQYRETAEKIIACFSGEVLENFFPLTTYLCGHEFMLRAKLYCVVGPDAAAVADQIWQNPGMNKVIMTAKDQLPNIDKTHPAYGKKPMDGKTTIYVCDGGKCLAPILNVEELMKKGLK
ncbi:MAG: thioredoxin domain-containing protein [Alphaproteobacteria bacterium]|nr:MAG: thioredoxin domain-containing protein [Alphaproteobacteria bacterium]